MNGVSQIAALVGALGYLGADPLRGPSFSRRARTCCSPAIA
jgi:hypothetical protein